MAQPDPPLAVIVLAAGSGTRMRSKTPKVLHALGGRSMIGHVLAAAHLVRPRHVVVVVGHGREQVGQHVLELLPDAVLAVQETQQGTGHAATMAMAELRRRAGDLHGTVLVISADTPLLEGATLSGLLAEHADNGAAVTMLTGDVAQPTGYGRVVRAADGSVRAVVEERDADVEQRAITEINSGVYAFGAAFLEQALGRIGNDNAKGEYYLTDVVGLAAGGVPGGVGAYRIADVAQIEGANDRSQLAALAAELNLRTLNRLMRAGVTVVDPSSTWVDVTVTCEQDVTLLPGVQLLGATTVAEDAVVGPDCTVRDVEVGNGAKVVRTHAELAVIGPGASVGPFSYVRPGTRLGAGGKIGAFVESKNADIGEGAKVPHLSYVGDVEIGEGANIGAGTIVANYDGVAKHRTSVGRHARTGSNNVFVAPVSVGDGAFTGGGTVVRRNVPPGALAVSAAPQRNLEGWVAAHRAGTRSAEAAEAAKTADAAAAGDGAAGGQGSESHGPSA